MFPSHSVLRLDEQHLLPHVGHIVLWEKSIMGKIMRAINDLLRKHQNTISGVIFSSLIPL